ncbi:hypothetical protein JXB28_01150 [Candidatus Woesearchaeota archaeon]|nr:hypothetical protein [Candidatus Woesearchaeota archaeon]
MRAIIILFIMATLIISGCFKELPLEQVQACKFDSDCIDVFDAGCCKCPTTINSDYKEYWDELTRHKSKGCEGAVCDPCPPKAIGTECKEGICVMMYSPVGLAGTIE